MTITKLPEDQMDGWLGRLHNEADLPWSERQLGTAVLERELRRAREQEVVLAEKLAAAAGAQPKASKPISEVIEEVLQSMEKAGKLGARFEPFPWPPGMWPPVPSLPVMPPDFPQLNCKLRNVLLQLAATRDPLEVPASDREPWVVNRMQFLGAEARRVLGITREEAREKLCGPKGPGDC